MIRLFHVQEYWQETLLALRHFAVTEFAADEKSYDRHAYEKVIDF